MKNQSAILTHVGNKRETNQDSVGAYGVGPLSFDRYPHPMLVVADGMGGHRGGETASRMAVKIVGEQYLAQLAGGESPATALRAAVQVANDRISLAGEKDIQLSGMGTTVVAAAFPGSYAYVANAGDSRAYLIRSGRIKQITEDHSKIAELKRMGVSEEQLAGVRRNAITRAVGRREQMKTDIYVEDWRVGDVLLMCSDGLWDMIPDAQILAVASEMAPKEAAKRLIDLALTTEAPDNISVAIAKRTS